MGCRSPSPGQQNGSPATRATKGLASERDSHESVQHQLDAKRHQRSSGAAKPPGRKQNTADRLILMGDWRDSFAAMNEETGAVWLLIGNWDLKILAADAAIESFYSLDAGRLMGVPIFTHFHNFPGDDARMGRAKTRSPCRSHASPTSSSEGSASNSEGSASILFSIPEN